MKYVAVEKDKRRIIKDVGLGGSAKIYRGHYLLVVTVKELRLENNNNKWKWTWKYHSKQWQDVN